MLVGAGRIGVVHALTLSRLQGIDLVGVVDTKKAALGMLRGMGLRTPAFTSLDDAVRETRPGAAVIATPVLSHLRLASWAGGLLGALEWLLTPLNPWLALQHTLVLRRRAEGWTVPETLG